MKCITDITARYIRYRATKEHEDPVNLSNNSNVILKEILINEQQVATTSTDDLSLENLKTVKSENVITVSNENEITLHANKKIRTSFDHTKNLAMIKIDQDEAIVKVSMDGVHWEETTPNELKNVTARFVEVSNPTNHDIQISKIEYRLVGKLAMKASLVTNNGDVYSGNANNVVDNDENTTLWLKRGDNGNKELTRYIELDLQGIASLQNMEVLFAGDNKLYGRVDISTDQKNWETIYTFDKVGTSDQKIDFNNEKARYVRYYMSNGEWIQIKEISINKGLSQNTSNFDNNNEKYNDMIDGDIFTEFIPENAQESFVMNVDGYEVPNEFVLVKDATSTVNVEAKIKNKDLSEEWISLGKFKEAKNVIDLTKYDTLAVKVAWDNADNLKISEVYFDGHKEINKKELSKAIERAENVIKNGALDLVSEPLAKKLKDYLIYSLDVNDSSILTQNEINFVTSKLVSILNEFNADYSKVDEAITKANALDKNLYKDFSKVEEAVKAVVRDLDITKQKEVDAMADAINTAIDALVKKVDKSELQGLVDKTSEIDKKLYTEDTWKVFNEAFENAKEVLADDKATQEQVDEATQTLQKAIDGLKLKGQTPTDPEAPIDPETPDEPQDGVESNVPDTGDSTHLPLLMGILGASGLAVAIELKRKRSKEKR